MPLLYLIPRLWSRTILGFFASVVLTSCQDPCITDEGTNTDLDTGTWAQVMASSVRLEKPVVVVDAPLYPLYYGRIYFREDRYEIQLDRTLEPNAKLMVLAHEMAHALAHERGDLSGLHGDEWGKAFAAVTRVMVGEF